MKKFTILACIFSILIVLTACGRQTPATPSLPVEQTDPPAPTATPAQPTPTPLPLAARINDTGILLSEYEAEVQRQQAAEVALGLQSTPQEISQRVLDDLIGQTLLAQAAYSVGYSVEDAEVQARIDALVTELGSAQALADWQAANFYTPETFTAALRRQIAAIWQRDQVLSSLPTTDEQIHARQILVRQVETAERLLQQVQAGADFASLAWEVDPIIGGDLGWFCRGMLTQPAVEAAAFALQPGEISAIIPSDLGYHILQVIERDLQHPLLPEVLQQRQQSAIRQWVELQRSAAQIEILVTP